MTTRTYVLVACIGEHNHREATQGRYRTSPVHGSDIPSSGLGVSFNKVCQYQDNKIAY